MTINQDNYFDIGNLLINELAGGPMVAYFLVLAIIIFLSIKFRLPNNSMIALIIIWSLILTVYSPNMIIITLITLIVGLSVYFVYSKILKRS